MDLDKNLDLIDRYLNQELTGEDLVLFEERLQKDAKFSQEVEFQRKIILMLKENEILNILDKTHNEMLREKPTSSWKDNIDIPITTNFNNPLNRAKILAKSKYIYIKYQGDPNPPFPISNFSSILEVSTFTNFKIYLPSKSKSFHYLLAYTPNKHIKLSLYGKFKPNELTLIYYKEGNQDFFKLKIGVKIYPLLFNQPIAPLIEEDKS